MEQLRRMQEGRGGKNQLEIYRLYFLSGKSNTSYLQFDETYGNSRLSEPRVRMKRGYAQNSCSFAYHLLLHVLFISLMELKRNI